MIRIQKLGLILILSILFAATVCSVLPQKTFAQSATPPPDNAQDITNLGVDAGNPQAGEFVNGEYIKVTVNGQEYIFFDRNLRDDTNHFELQNSDCNGTLDFGETGRMGPGRARGQGNNNLVQANLRMQYKPLNGVCTDAAEVVVAINSSKAEVWAEYKSTDEIVYLTSNTSYRRVSGAGTTDSVWLGDDDGGVCSNLMVVSADGASYRLYRLADNRRNGTDGINTVPQGDRALIAPYFPETCEIYNVIPYANEEAGSYKQNGLWQAPDFPLGDGVESARINSELPGNTSSADSCESKGGDWSWVLCPTLRIMDATVSFLDSAINALLYVKYDKYTESGQLELVWTRMRNLALLIVIPIFLVMIISTMLGYNFVDAYTIKRSLPRLLVAILFITLSWDLCRIMIEMTNAVGRGMAGLIATVVGEDASSLTLMRVFGGIEGAVFSWTLGLGAGGAVVGAGIFLAGASWIFIPLLIIIGLLILAAVIALLILFLLLGFRQMLVVALVLVAPLAILSWIFPGNDKLWKLWWNMFSKLLLLFPVIIILITIGKVFALIIHETGGADNAAIFSTFVDFILKFSAYFLPYLLIPAAFKWAGGVFANVTGMAGNARKGILSFGKGLRKKQYQKLGKQGAERLKGGKFFNKTDSEFYSKLNARGQQLAHLKNVGDSGLTNWRSDIKAGIQATEKAEQKHIMEDALFNVYAGFDDLSGMAADVIMGNAEGIKKRLMMKGIGVELDADGKVVKDEKGNMVIAGAAGEATLSREVESIMSRQRSGDMRGALRQGLVSAKAFGDEAEGTLNEEALETNLSHVMTGLRTYGTQPFVQALVKKAGAGGTYYNDASDAWLAAGMSAGTDTAAEADMAATLRGILTNAGRADEGGGSFGKTIGFMRDLQAAQTDEERKEVLDKYMEHVIDNTPASTMFHASMKTGYIDDNVISRIRERLKKAKEDADGTAPDSVENKKFMRLLADVENTHRMAQQTKPELAEKIGDGILNMDFTTTDASGNVVPSPIMVDVQEAYEVPGMFADDGVTPLRGVRTVQKAINNPLEATHHYARTSPQYEAYNRQWQQANEEQQQMLLQQQQQQQQQRQGPGTPPGGLPPAGGPP